MSDGTADDADDGPYETALLAILEDIAEQDWQRRYRAKTSIRHAEDNAPLNPVTLARVVCGELVSPSFAMKKPTDTQRLNWLEKQNACLRYDAEDEASLPQAVVFLPTLENGESTFRAAGHGDTFREAIDDAMESDRRERKMAKLGITEKDIHDTRLTHETVG